MILSYKQDRIFFAFSQKYFWGTPQFEHSFYITISEKVSDFKAFPNVAVIAFAVLLNPCLFSLFPPFNIQKAVIEPLGHPRRLLCCLKKRKEKIVIVSSFSTEPKSRYAAQSDYFTVKAEPSRLREKIRPEGKDGCSCLRKAVVKAAPVRCVSRYSKQGLCVPQKS